MSVLIGIVIVFTVYYNTAQLVDVTTVFTDQHHPKGIVAVDAFETDRTLGMGGGSALMLVYIVMCMVVFLNKYEKPVLVKSQKVCFGLVGVLLFVSLMTYTSTWIAKNMALQNPMGAIILEIVLSGLRIVMATSLVICGMHTVQSN